MMEGLGGWRTLKHSAVLRGDLSGGSPRLPLHSELKLEDLEAFQFAESSQRGVQVAIDECHSCLAGLLRQRATAFW